MDDSATCCARSRRSPSDTDSSFHRHCHTLPWNRAIFSEAPMRRKDLRQFCTLNETMITQTNRRNSCRSRLMREQKHAIGEGLLRARSGSPTPTKSPTEGFPFRWISRQNLSKVGGHRSEMGQKRPRIASDRPDSFRIPQSTIRNSKKILTTPPPRDYTFHTPTATHER